MLRYYESMSYVIPQFEQDPKKIYISQPTFYSMGLDLAQKVIDRQEQTGVFYDTIVGAPRGSLELMSMMSQILLMKGQQVQCMNVNTRSDSGEQSEIKTGQVPETAKIEGKNCLWLDDVRDTGVTEDAAERILLSLGAKLVDRGDLGWKPKNDKAIPVRQPDFYIFETNEWVVFSWERLAEYRHAQQALKLVVPPEQLEKALRQLKSNFMRAQGFSSVPYFSGGVVKFEIATK